MTVRRYFTAITNLQDIFQTLCQKSNFQRKNINKNSNYAL